MKSTDSPGKFLPLYPFFVAMFPLLYVTSRHKNEVSKISTLIELVVLTLALLIAAFLLYLLVKKLVKDTFKTALITSIIIAVFFYYNHLKTFLQPLSKSPIPDLLVVVIQLLVVSYVTVLIIRTPRKLENITRVIQFTVIVFFVVSAYKPVEYITKFIVKTKPQLRELKQYQEQEAQNLIKTGRNTAGNEMPDIYYIILDRYASAPNLKRYYNTNNREFTEYLLSKKFYVAHGSRNNYPVTGLSLASSLNMKYYDFLGTLYHDNKTEDYRIAYYLIEHNTVAKFLKSRGYTYIYMGSFWEPTCLSTEADENFYDPPMRRRYLDRLLSLTPLKPLLSRWLGWNSVRDHWSRENNKFEYMSRIPYRKEPTFVVAHVLVPHEPFVYDANGRFLIPKEQLKRSEREKYRDQVLYISKRVQWLVDKLQKRSKTQPVIIVQADEGPYPPEYKRNLKHLLRMPDRDLKIKVGILNAYYLPGFDTRKLYQTISPVNTFRLVLNHYFGTNLELLPDKSHMFDNWSRLYEFTDITSRVQDTYYQELLRDYQNRRDGSRSYEW